MEHKKAQAIGLAMIASAILAGFGFVALAIRPNEEGSIIAIVAGGLPFFIYMRMLYTGLLSKKGSNIK